MTYDTDILILGASIGGYQAYKQLRKKMPHARITIVDQNDCFTFVPLLHEVATGALPKTLASAPLSSLIKGRNSTVIQGRVTQIDPEKQIVMTSAGDISFETCLIALGSQTNFFGTPGAAQNAFPLRTLDQATKLFDALKKKIEEKKGKQLHIRVVGGGYTGVEVASQLAELSKTTAKKYPGTSLRISIIHAAKTVLPALSASVQKKAAQRLRHLGIELILEQRASEVTPQHISLSSGTSLESDLTIWTTGFQTEGNTLIGETFCDRGRIIVDEYLQSTQSPHIYAIGDIALMRDPKHPETIYPQLGEVAYDSATIAAHNIAAAHSGGTKKPFYFHPKGMLIPIGEWYGIGIFRKFTFSGKMMWLARQAAYVIFLPGVIRKFKIILHWKLHLIHLKKRI